MILIYRYLIVCSHCLILQVNITESARDSIQQAFAMGKVDRGLFHEAIMAVFPNLIFCWKK